MTEIKNVSRAAIRLLQDLLGAFSHQLFLGKKQHRIHIPLHYAAITKQLPAFVERYTPIETDHIGSGLLH